MDYEKCWEHIKKESFTRKNISRVCPDDKHRQFESGTMTIEGFLNWINPKKKAWWRKDAWVRQKTYSVHEILEENNGCSWDIETYWVIHYKHKHSCEDRMKIERDLVGRKTIFEHPDEKMKSENIEHVKVYDGPKYE